MNSLVCQRRERLTWFDCKKAGTANLKDKRLQNMILTIFKCLHFSDYPRYLKDMFCLRSSTYFSRGHNMLCLPKPLTTSYGINFFSYLAATSWNSLCDHHRTISDFTSFRRLISTGSNILLKRAGTFLHQYNLQVSCLGTVSYLICYIELTFYYNYLLMQLARRYQHLRATL